MNSATPEAPPKWVLALALFSLVLGLTGCQTKPPQTGLSAEQIAVLQERGFELRDEGWEFGMSTRCCSATISTVSIPTAATP